MNIDINNVEVLNIKETNSKKNYNNKNGNIKILLLIAVIILIILFGIGLYTFLKYAKETTKVTDLKDEVIELGTKIDEKNINFTSDNNNCKIDLSNVDTNKVGTYKYYVICNKRKYSANIIVKDTTAPQVELKIVNIKKNDNLEAKQFILSTKDFSKVDYSFGDNFKLNDYNLENGVYIIPLKIFDEYKNVKDVSGILLVSNLASAKFLSASKEMSTNYDATLEVIDKIGFNQVDYYINAIRIYDYTFNNKNEYNKVKNEYNSNNNINKVEGKIILDEEKLNIKLIELLTRNELNKLNGEFPFTYDDIQRLYNSLKYETEIEKN